MFVTASQYCLMRTYIQLYLNNVAGCVWFLDAMASPSTGWNADYLLSCNDVDTRKKIGELIVYALSFLCTYEEHHIQHYLDRFNSNSSSSVSVASTASADAGGEADKPQGAVLNYIENVLSLLSQTSTYWKSFNEYFKVIAAFASQGPLQARYLLRRGVLGTFMQIRLRVFRCMCFRVCTHAFYVYLYEPAHTLKVLAGWLY